MSVLAAGGFSSLPTAWAATRPEALAGRRRWWAPEVRDLARYATGGSLAKARDLLAAMR